MKILSRRQVLLLHEQLVRETGGSPGLRDEGLLESALAAPMQSFDGVDIYPTLWQKAARLAFGLVKNHPFVDGNKRIGAHAMLERRGAAIPTGGAVGPFSVRGCRDGGL